MHAVSGKIITSDRQGIFRIGNWFLYARILPSPRRCPVCCEILDLLGIVRLEGGRYKNQFPILKIPWRSLVIIFPEMAWTYLLNDLHKFPS